MKGVPLSFDVGESAVGESAMMMQMTQVGVCPGGDI